MVCFDKANDGERAGWEGSHDGVKWKPGLEKVIEMTSDEFIIVLNVFRSCYLNKSFCKF